MFIGFPQDGSHRISVTDFYGEIGIQSDLQRKLRPGIVLILMGIFGILISIEEKCLGLFIPNSSTTAAGQREKVHFDDGLRTTVDPGKALNLIRPSV